MDLTYQSSAAHAALAALTDAYVADPDAAMGAAVAFLGRVADGDLRGESRNKRAIAETAQAMLAAIYEDDGAVLTGESDDDDARDLQRHRDRHGL